MPKIVHFDIPADDIKRARKFYEDLLGWKFELLDGPEEYYEVTTEEGSLQGGMGQRQGDQKITNFVGVDDIDRYINDVKKYGGRVVTPKIEVPGYGWIATCLDTEGNAFGLWQTK